MHIISIFVRKLINLHQERITNNKPTPDPRPQTLKKLLLLTLVLLLFNKQTLFSQTDYLITFSDPSQLWGNGIEKIIEEGYRRFFITRVIDGRIMNIRMPFAANEERSILIEGSWDFYGKGKASPEVLWPVIEEILDSQPFLDYISSLSSGRERVFIFDIPEQKWSFSTDLFDIARMKAGSYRGFLHRPYVLTSGRGAELSDVYNYLYCIGRTGIDCSGFVYHMLDYIAKQGGVDLERIFRQALGIPRGADPAYFAGTNFYNSSSREIIAVDDKIRNLKPADIILFRDKDGTIAHSAIIQSVDFTKGVIRYLQCTDEAPLSERGVHESFIFFEPESPDVSLKDLSLNWTQKRFAPFPGEKDSPFSNDGERYRAYPEKGAGRVVRLRALEPVVKKFGTLIE